MDRQHTENLFRRYKGQRVNIRTISGGIYEGHVSEITNDYVCLTQKAAAETSPVFLFFTAIESLTASETSE